MPPQVRNFRMIANSHAIQKRVRGDESESQTPKRPQFFEPDVGDRDRLGSSTEGITMLANRPLRGLGPKVFISYSFADRLLAQRIEEYLASRGMQVKKEDETSLLAEQLSQALPRRVADAEVFVQILTETSVQSNWVYREFEWAVAASKLSTKPAIVPVVFGNAKPQDPISDWVYIKSAVDLEDATLDAIGRASLTSIELLPLDSSLPFQFEHDRVADLLQLKWVNRRRILADSGGLLLAIADDRVRVAESADPKIRKRFIAQESRSLDRIRRVLVDADRVLPRLFQELHEGFAHYGSDYPGRAIEPVQRFARLVFGIELLHSWNDFHPDILQPYSRILEDAQNVVEQGQAQDPSSMDFGYSHWALGTRPSDNSSEWVEVGLDPVPGKAPAQVLLPKSGFGDEWSLSLQFGSEPSAEVQDYDWADFGVPQIARRATYALGRPEPPDAILNAQGWKLIDYRQIGSAN